MIITECQYCDEPFIYPYDAGDEGAGGFAEVECEFCKKLNYVQLISSGAGKTMTKEYFWEHYPDATKI